MAEGGGKQTSDESSGNDEETELKYMYESSDSEETKMEYKLLLLSSYVGVDVDHYDDNYDNAARTFDRYRGRYWKKEIDLFRNVKGGKEPRHDLKIIVVGHLAAGKTTLILRLLLEHFDMNQTQSTNGIINLRKGAVLLNNGKLKLVENPKDVAAILRRIKRAEDRQNIHTVRITQRQMKHAEDLNNQIESCHIEEDRAASSNSDEKTDEQSEEGITCRVQFMDFAGQSVFNSTHQMFMSHSAIYLLVLDISKDLNDEVEDDDVYCVGENQRMSVEEITEFLLNSIHVYTGDQEDSFPKVLLIGTHKDKVDEDTARKRMKQLILKFRDTPLAKHVLDQFIVNGAIRDDPETDRLRERIFEIAQQEPYWGKETPTSWLPLENSIINRREKEDRVLTMETIKQMNKACMIRLKIPHEIEDFLKFHNKVGNLMYFHKIAPNIIILDPQWLIDGLKQIITYRNFYQKPEGLDAAWEDFTQCAKLDKKLIEVIWSTNKDRTFFNHMTELLAILEKTDIIASPLMYKEGIAETASYYFVPSMLKPNADGKPEVESSLNLCQTRSPSLCFVFEDKFMQPAIFPRIQAACSTIYKIKEVQNRPLVFHRIAVFQLNQELDLVVEQMKYAIKVTIINEKGTVINSAVCQNVQVILEDALSNIVRLYGDKVPFHKALQCKKSTTDLVELFDWQEHLHQRSDNVICKAHEPDKRHIISKTDIFGPWLPCAAQGRKSQSLSMEGHMSINSDLQFKHLARLARRVDPESLLIAVSTEVPAVELKHCKIDNERDVQGETYDSLIKWRKRKDSLTLDVVYEALMDAKSDITLPQLQEAIADTNTTEHLKGFDQTFLQTDVNDEVIDLISQRSAKTYKFLALELGIEHHDVETIVRDHTRVTKRTKRLLEKWKSDSSSTAFIEIARAIIEIDEDMEILKDCEYLMKNIGTR